MVGVYHHPPFAIKSEDAAWDGIAVHLWREIADDLEIKYELREIDRNQVVSLLQEGTVDVVITAIATTERIQFQPYQAPLEGLKAVQAEEIEAFVYDSAALHFVNSETLNGSLKIGVTDRQVHRHAFALPEEHGLHELLNQKLLEKTSTSAWRDLVERYLPEPSSR